MHAACAAYCTHCFPQSTVRFGCAVSPPYQLSKHVLANTLRKPQVSAAMQAFNMRHKMLPALLQVRGWIGTG